MNKGWDDYCTDAKGWRPKSSRAISDTADALIRSVCGLYDGPGSPLSDIQETMGRLKNAAGGDNAIAYALVVTPGWTSIGQKDNISGTALQRNDFSRLVLSFRATRHAPMLFSQPIFSTEVRFQGQRRQ